MTNDQTSPEIQKTATDSERKTTKIWSEKANKYRYVPKDPNYFTSKYREYTRAKVCPHCGSIINTQMIRHNKTNKCKLFSAGGAANAAAQIVSSVEKEAALQN
jgi:formamidopyrimidine-DNA glycosylase